MRKIISVCLMLFLTYSGNTFSKNMLSISGYKKLKEKHPEIVKIHVNGVGQGFLWSNGHDGRKPIYCAPAKLALNGDNYMQIIDDQIPKYENAKTDFPIEMLLLKGLEESFPCS